MVRRAHSADRSKMSQIKDFKLILEALNKEGTFSEGDTIPGKVTFKLTDDTKVKSLSVMAKGEANVEWTEGSGEKKKWPSAHQRYFKVKKYVLEENAQGIILPQGVHHFKFCLKIPERNMPSSFKGTSGMIIYMVEAKISRSWRRPSTVSKEINFVSKAFPHSGQVMCPQSSSVTRQMGPFGGVQMSATLNRKICSPGDTLSAVAKIYNSSFKKMTAKFSLQQKTVYRASDNTTTCDKTLFMSGDSILPNTEVTASCQVKIPVDAIYSLHNCDIISVKHYLKVYLDINFDCDPEVVFPLVIVPSSVVTIQTGEDVGPYPPGATRAPSYSDFPPPAFPVGLNPVPTGSGPSQCQAPNPIPYTSITRGYHNQLPQIAPPYRFSTTASTSSSVQHPAHTAPPQFQQEEDPPSYSSLFLTPDDMCETDHQS